MIYDGYTNYVHLHLSFHHLQSKYCLTKFNNCFTVLTIIQLLEMYLFKNSHNY